MFPTGWTEMLPRAALVLLGVCALSACGTMTSGAAPGASDAAAIGEEQSPDLQFRYETLLVRLRAGDATAVADLEKFSAEHPGFAGPLLNLGLIRARTGDADGARELFERATAVCSSCGSAWNELGVLHSQQGRFTDAEAAYQQGIAADAGYAHAYYNLAILYELYIPRPDLALQNYERFLELDESVEGRQDVQRWVAELRRRVGETPQAARAEGAQ